MPTLDSWLRSLLRGDDRLAALKADAERGAKAGRTQASEYEACVAPYIRCRDGLLFGTTELPERRIHEVRLAARIAQGSSGWVTGATGSGKTRGLLALALQDFATPHTTCIAADFKGDLAEGLIEAVIPWLATQLPPEQGAELLHGLRVWAPWNSDRLPSMHLTFPGGSLRRRAIAIAELFVATIAAGEFGHRQQSLLLPCLRLMIATGTPLALLGEVLNSAALRDSLIDLARDAELTSYFRDRFPADSREGVAFSILSRFDRFISDESTRLALFGEDPFDPAEWLESGATVCDFGGGLGTHQRFWAAAILHGLTTAILSRRVTRESPRVVVRVDEVQVGIASQDQARELENTLSLMRSRRASLWVAHQHAGQLAEHPALLQSLRTNTGVQVAFRSPRETTSAMATVLPDQVLPGILRHDVTEAQMRQAWEIALAALPERVFLLRCPELSPIGIPVRTPVVDLDSMRRQSLPEARFLARQGARSYSKADLAKRERLWRQLAAELGRAATPNSDALARAVAPRTTTPSRPRRVEVG